MQEGAVYRLFRVRERSRAIAFSQFWGVPSSPHPHYLNALITVSASVPSGSPDDEHLLRLQHRRLAARRGQSRAVSVVDHSFLVFV